jgi:hypothetical protein
MASAPSLCPFPASADHLAGRGPLCGCEAEAGTSTGGLCQGNQWPERVQIGDSAAAAEQASNSFNAVAPA